MTLRPILAAALTLALAGCDAAPPAATAPAPSAPAPSAPALSAPATQGIANPANAIPATRALQLFDRVCGASLPDDFASAKARIAKEGFTIASPAATGTMYSQREDASFKISDGPGFGNTCSMVFTSTDPQAKVAATLGQIGRFQGNMTIYRGQRRLVIFDTPGSANGHIYYHLALLSDH